MSKAKVLIEGYAREKGNTLFASSTTTLIKDSGKIIIVDPGINKSLLSKSLQKENLRVEDINIVFLTHFHLDHSFLSALFQKSIVLDGETIYEKDKESNYESEIPGSTIKIIPTPGHAPEHHSLLVKTVKGKVAIVGDVFWWKEGETQKIDISKNDPYANDIKLLIKSRQKILRIADWIIPGHGKKLKVQNKNL